MTLEEEMRMVKNWRGRRFLACRAMQQIERVIDNLGVEDGTAMPPEHGSQMPISPPVKNEIANAASVLLRLILAANDGSVSPARLRTF
jgi:hypothetical protein